MSVNVLFAAREAAWANYEAPLRAALKDAGVKAQLSTDLPAEEVDYIVYAPNSDLQDFAPFTRTKAVLNLWAGVESIVQNPSLTQPLARMVDEDGLTQGMVEWVTGHVLRHHLGMDAHIVNPDHEWNEQAPPLARERIVTILGLGTLGTACAEMLVRLGFRVRGWSRSGRRANGVDCFAGQNGLEAALNGADIVVLLLPDTPATENVMSAHSLSLIKRGGVIINPGRGPLIDDAALLSALDTGQVGHATLDVFRTEPLPQSDPYWAHPHVTVTPHIASETRTDSAARVVAENIRRGEAGEPFLHLVDRAAGY